MPARRPCRRSPDRSRFRRSPACEFEPLEQRRVLSVAPLVVRGDRDASRLDDLIVVEADPVAPQRVVFTVNGTVVARRHHTWPGRVVIDGGSGNDVIRVDLPRRQFGIVLRGGVGDDFLGVSGRGTATVSGGAGDDTLVGGRGPAQLLGDAGDDTLVAGAGRAVLAGGAGADQIFGHRSKDRIVADRSDTLAETRQTSPLVRAANLAEVGRWLAAGSARTAVSAVMRGMETLARGVASSLAGGLANAAQSTTAGHSGTNNQVAGVEEGDLVQTDGRFIYLVGGGRLRIIDTAAGQLSETASLPVAGDAGELFLHAGRITLVSTVWTSDGPPASTPGDEEVGGGAPGSEAGSPAAADSAAAAPAVSTQVMPVTPAVDEEGRVGILPILFLEPEVRVTVIDVTSPTAPVVVEELAIDGRLAAARSIGARIHLVIDSGSLFGLPFARGGFQALAAEPLPPGGTAVGVGDKVVSAVPSAADLAAGLPQVKSTTAAGTTTSPLVDPGAIYLPLGGAGDGILTVATFSPVDAVAGIDHSVTTLGLAGVVQASADTLVVASTEFDADWTPRTVLTSFALGEQVTHLATGSVAGWVPDQFAIDTAADGTLRIVVHEGWRRQAVTVVHVLERQGLDLASIGRLGGIAPGEDLKAVRFLGDTAYVVTFEEVDPLFAIDLGDPRRPRVAGELKIPGFSSYLQEMEPGRLFGIGQGDEPGTAKVSLFDISGTAPREVDSAPVVEGAGWSHSEAAHEHRAFSWFREQRLLAVPFSNWTWSETESTLDEGLRVFSVDRDAGFTKVADLRHEGAAIRRSLRIGETLYTVSSAGVVAHDLAGELRTVAAVRFS